MAYARRDPKVAIAYFANEDLDLKLPFQFNPYGIQRNKEPNYSDFSIPGLDSSGTIWTSGGPFTLSFTSSWDARPSHLKNAIITSKGNDRFSFRNDRVQDRLNIPGTSQIDSIRSFINALRGKSGITGDDTQFLDITKYLNLDNQEYNPDLGVLPHIAIIETFLRPTNLNLKSQRKKSNSFGSLREEIQRLTTNSAERLVGPPKCMFHWGNRVFEGLLKAAAITEVIHNEKGVPTRIDVEFEYFVLEFGAFFENYNTDRYTYAIQFSNALNANSTGGSTTATVTSNNTGN